MPYIDASVATFASRKRKRGRPSFGTCDPKLDRREREAARLYLEGKAKSRRAALKQVLGADGSESAFLDAYCRLNERWPALLRAAARAKEIEDNDPQKGKIQSFDPVLHKAAAPGTYAFINQNSADWKKAGVAGWTLVEVFGHDEALIRRDFPRGILTPGSAEMKKFLQDCAAEFAQSGLFVTSRRRLAFDRTPISTTTPLRLAHKSLWARIRRDLLKKHGLKCLACPYVPPTAAELDGHEVHSFPGGGVIRLERVLLLCRKCHHCVHLERSLVMERERAFRAWLSEHRPTDKRRLRYWPTVEAYKAARAAGDEASARYRADMVEHYCKVNRVTAKQFERDWEAALPPADIMQLRETNRKRCGTDLLIVGAVAGPIYCRWMRRRFTRCFW